MKHYIHDSEYEFSEYANIREIRSGRLHPDRTCGVPVEGQGKLHPAGEHEQPRQDVGIAPVGQDHVRVMAVEQLIEPGEKLRAVVSLQTPLLSLHPYE